MMAKSGNATPTKVGVHRVVGRHRPKLAVSSSGLTTRAGSSAKPLELSPMTFDIDESTIEVVTLLGNQQVAVSLGVLEAMRRADDAGVTDLTIETTSDRISEQVGQTWDEDEPLLTALNWAIRSSGSLAFDVFCINVV